MELLFNCFTFIQRKATQLQQGKPKTFYQSRHDQKNTIMKNTQKDKKMDARAGLQELTAVQLAATGGGYAPLLLGIPVAMKAVYDLGKAVGRELYHLHNS